jgi:hypothetical protein
MGDPETHNVTTIQENNETLFWVSNSALHKMFQMGCNQWAFCTKSKDNFEWYNTDLEGKSCYVQTISVQ